MERSNCFDIINSFCRTGTLNKLKITITSSFAKLTYNIFKACLNLMCYQEDLNHLITETVICTVLTVDTENAPINARSTKLCF